MHILVCSNSLALVEIVSHAFGHLGPRFTVCESGLELLRAVDGGGADLLILDLQTTGLNGPLMVAAIQELAPGLPLLAISKDPDVDARALTQKGVAYTTLGGGEVHTRLTQFAHAGKGAAAVEAGAW